MLEELNKEVTYRDCLLYKADTGEFFVKRDKPKKILASEEGYLKFSKDNKSYKIKASLAAWELGYGSLVPFDKVVLHKNLNFMDYRLRNLSLVSREVYLEVKEARKNLEGFLKMQPHKEVAFSYVVQWKEKGKVKQQVMHDVVTAKKLLLKLQLKFSKVLSKYCVFD